jgi:hypothetical protein
MTVLSDKVTKLRIIIADIILCQHVHTEAMEESVAGKFKAPIIKGLF